MNGAAMALLIGTVVVLLVLGVMGWRKPGPDARGVTTPPEVRRDTDLATPGAEGEAVPEPGEVAPGP